MSIVSFSEVLNNVVLALTAAFGAYLAFHGVSAWIAQHVWPKKYDAATEARAARFELQEKIREALDAMETDVLEDMLQALTSDERKMIRKRKAADLRQCRANFDKKVSALLAQLDQVEVERVRGAFRRYRGDVDRFEFTLVSAIEHPEMDKELLRVNELATDEIGDQLENEMATFIPPRSHLSTGPLLGRRNTND